MRSKPLKTEPYDRLKNKLILRRKRAPGVDTVVRGEADRGLFTGTDALTNQGGSVEIIPATGDTPIRYPAAR